MFGVDFSELGIIFIVALVVLGPARLPGLVRKVGLWMGKARAMARQFREQLESEVNVEELKRLASTQTPAPTYPPPPPELSGEPVVDAAADTHVAEPAPDNVQAEMQFTLTESEHDHEHHLPPQGDPSHNDLSAQEDSLHERAH
jgi:sec-independent protein translocase protein TatB